MANRKWAWASAVFILLVAPALLSSSQQSRWDKAAHENRELDRQVIQAVVDRDADRLMRFYWNSPELLAIGTEGEVGQGWEQMKAIEEKFYSSLESCKAEIVHEAKYPLGDDVWSVLSIKYAFQVKDGPFLQGTMQITDLRRKIGGKWLIVFNHGHDLPEPKLGKP